LPEGRGRVLDNVGHGTVLTGRYRLVERLRESASSALWQALDETLERSVQVTLLDPALPRTADILDAARRVTLAQDPRLAKVLDVSRDGEVAFVVVEHLPGRTLTQAVAGAPLPAVEARRLVGEAAEALSGAADRGLHHQCLAPETLVVDPDGSIKVTGTAVEAAASGSPSRDGDAASRVDALGLVCVLYAALTGRWPGTTPSDLPAAPRVGGRPVAPADLVAGVPADLDELCTQTLGNGGNGQDGPTSPAEVAQRSRQPVARHTNPRGPLTATPARPGSTSTGAPAAPAPSIGRSAASATRVAAVDGVSPGGFQGWDDLSTIGVPVPDEEPLVPFAPAVPVEQPPSDQSRFVIGLVVTFVVLVMMVAVISLRTLGPPTELIPRDITRAAAAATGTAGPGRTDSSGVTASGTPASSPTAPVTATVAPTPSASPEVVGAQAIDPQGDGEENNDRAARAIDGNSSTVWKSNYYATTDFAEMKDGVGLVLHLGSGAVPDVRQVIIDVEGSGGTVELRTTPSPGLEGSATVAQSSIENGRAVLIPAKPVNSRLLVLWFTKLPKTDGKYQLLVSEINVR
jgi:hypothetical protein